MYNFLINNLCFSKVSKIDTTHGETTVEANMHSMPMSGYTTHRHSCFPMHSHLDFTKLKIVASHLTHSHNMIFEEPKHILYIS